MSTATAPFDPRQLRNVLGAFVTGVTVVTTRDAAGVAHGVTANSFSSVSLEPPLVLWSQALTSKSYPAFHASSHFTVNILAEDQVELSNHFARSRDDKFDGVGAEDGLNGSPVLAGAAAHLECVKVAEYPGGDHVIYLGQVQRIGHAERRPLAFGAGRYMAAYGHDLSPLALHLGSSSALPMDAVREIILALPQLAEELGGHTLCLASWGNHGPTAIYWEPSRQPVSRELRPGLVLPLTHSASGCAFAAFLPEEATRALLEEELRQPSADRQGKAQRRERFAEELAQARRHGVARHVGQQESPLHRQRVNALSVPLFGPQQRMLLALSVTAPAARLAPEYDSAVALALKAAAEGFSRLLQQALRSAA